MAEKRKKLSKKERAQQEAALQKQRDEQRRKVLAPYEIHVMPQKFVGVQAPVGKKRGSGLSLKVVGIVASVILTLGLLGYIAFVLYQSLNEPIAQPPVNTNTAVNTNTNTNTATNVNTNTNTAVNTNTNTNTNVNTNTATNGNENTNTAGNENQNTAGNQNTNTTPGGVLPASVDTDNDGLTDEEERLYGTELRLADTDGDGFIDGQEVINLYSPFAAGAVLLQDVASVNVFSNPTMGYTFLNPASWLVRATDDSRREVVLTSRTGEMFYVEVFDNPDNVALSQWLIDNQPQINPNTLTNYTTGRGLTAVVTGNELVYFVAAPTQSRVYRLTYDPGTVNRLNYKTTFRMLANSLTLQ